MLRPQDLVVATELALPGMNDGTYVSLASKLALSTSEAHAAVRRARLAGLVRGRAVDRRAVIEQVEHGAPYADDAIRGAPRHGGYPPASWPLSRRTRVRH